MTEAIIYTIGHSNHPPERFLELLGLHGIESVADVRSHPGSRFNPQFNRGRLERALAAAGMRYVFLGAELGARSADPACYEGGRVSYRRLAATADFARGLERLAAEAHAARVALMCAERDPLECHRTILVARELVHRGRAVAHILADGALETWDAALERLVARLSSGEPDLFGADRASLAEHALDVQARRIAFAPRAPRS